MTNPTNVNTIICISKKRYCQGSHGSETSYGWVRYRYFQETDLCGMQKGVGQSQQLSVAAFHFQYQFQSIFSLLSTTHSCRNIQTHLEPSHRGVLMAACITKHLKSPLSAFVHQCISALNIFQMTVQNICKGTQSRVSLCFACLFWHTADTKLICLAGDGCQ